MTKNEFAEAYKSLNDLLDCIVESLNAIEGFEDEKLDILISIVHYFETATNLLIQNVSVDEPLVL